MKKILIVAAIILVSTATFAQGFRIGLKASPSLAWLKPDTKGIQTDGSALRFGYGLITEFGLSENYAFATGLEVDYSGGSLRYDSTIYYLDINNDSIYLKSRDYNMQYVTIPLTIKMKTNPVGAMSYFGQFGFNPSVNIKSRSEDIAARNDNNVNAPTSTYEDNDIIKDSQFMRIALNIGAGFEYNIAGETMILVGVNYNNGFTNILRKESKQLVYDSDNTAFDQKATSNFVALTVGIIF